MEKLPACQLIRTEPNFWLTRKWKKIVCFQVGKTFATAVKNSFCCWEKNKSKFLLFVCNLNANTSIYDLDTVEAFLYHTLDALLWFSSVERGSLSPCYYHSNGKNIGDIKKTQDFTLIESNDTNQSHGEQMMCTRSLIGSILKN